MKQAIKEYLDLRNDEDALLKKLKILACSPAVGEFPSIKEFSLRGGSREEAAEHLTIIDNLVRDVGNAPWSPFFLHALWLKSLDGFDPSLEYDAAVLQGKADWARREQKRIMSTLGADELFRYKQLPLRERIGLPKVIHEWESREEKRILEELEKQERHKMRFVLKGQFEKEFDPSTEGFAEELDFPGIIIPFPKRSDDPYM